MPIHRVPETDLRYLLLVVRPSGCQTYFQKFFQWSNPRMVSATRTVSNPCAGHSGLSSTVDLQGQKLENRDVSGDGAMLPGVCTPGSMISPLRGSKLHVTFPRRQSAAILWAIGIRISGSRGLHPGLYDVAASRLGQIVGDFQSGRAPPSETRPYGRVEFRTSDMRVRQADSEGVFQR